MGPAGPFLEEGGCSDRDRAGPAGPGAGSWESAHGPDSPFPRDQGQCSEDTVRLEVGRSGHQPWHCS